MKMKTNNPVFNQTGSALSAPVSVWVAASLPGHDTGHVIGVFSTAEKARAVTGNRADWSQDPDGEWVDMHGDVAVFEVTVDDGSDGG